MSNLRFFCEKYILLENFYLEMSLKEKLNGYFPKAKYQHA